VVISSLGSRHTSHFKEIALICSRINSITRSKVEVGESAFYDTDEDNKVKEDEFSYYENRGSRDRALLSAGPLWLTVHASQVLKKVSGMEHCG
jgi:hypothetical protein